MEYFAEIAKFIGQQLIDFEAETPPIPRSGAAYRKGSYIGQVILMVGPLATASLLPIGIAFIPLFMGNKISITYLGITTILALVTAFSSLLIVPKILSLARQYLHPQIIHESSTAADEIKYELGAEIIFFVLGLLPAAHIVFSPLTMDRAINVLELAGLPRGKTRKLAKNMAGYCAIFFMVNSLIISIALLLIGSIS